MGAHNLHCTENNKQLYQLTVGKENLLYRTPKSSFIYNL